jgi:eukaryotic-like serine/threonine-protein kinase
MTMAATLLGGRYLLDEQIGAGAFSEVWRASDTVLARPVAVKLLHASHVGQPDIRARFRAEAHYAGLVSHENITRVYDYDEPSHGQSYLVMELIDGPSLAAVLAAGPLGAAQTMDVVAQVAAGLQAAHSAGLIHRDIKPTNIVFTGEGTARITDFGIAHLAGSAPLTATGMVLGTADYLAPERITGAQAQPSSDLYSLGIMAYECLAGARPFSGTPLQIAIAHRDCPLPPLPVSLPAEVAAFVGMLTAKDPAARPASADDVACHARRLRDQHGPAAIGTRPRSAGTLSTTGAHVTEIQGVRSRTHTRQPPHRTHTRRPSRPSHTRQPPQLRAAAALAAGSWLALLTVASLTPSPRPGAGPSSVPRQPAPVTKSPSARPSVPGRAGSERPSASPVSAGTAAAATQHVPPGQVRPKNNPASHGSGHALGRRTPKHAKGS